MGFFISIKRESSDDTHEQGEGKYKKVLGINRAELRKYKRRERENSAVASKKKKKKERLTSLS